MPRGGGNEKLQKFDFCVFFHKNTNNKKTEVHRPHTICFLHIKFEIQALVGTEKLHLQKSRTGICQSTNQSPKYLKLMRQSRGSAEKQILRQICYKL